MMKLKLFILTGFLFFLSGMSPAGKSDVPQIDGPRLTKLIKERKGKILFLNLWATWCQPCREEFPSIVKLSEEFKDVEFAGISIDYPDEVDSRIIPFLKRNKVGFSCYVSGFKHDEDLINRLDKNWSGSLPATFIFDGHGKKIAFLSGKKSYVEFKNEIVGAKWKI
jgi:thiol-disulfide isomerase/thioredoxin